MINLYYKTLGETCPKEPSVSLGDFEGPKAISKPIVHLDYWFLVEPFWKITSQFGSSQIIGFKKSV